MAFFDFGGGGGGFPFGGGFPGKLVILKTMFILLSIFYFCLSINSIYSVFIIITENYCHCLW